MILPTHEGPKEAIGVEFRIEGIEQAIRVVVSDGTVLMTRATLTGVFTYVNNDNSIGYHLSYNLSAVKIG